MVDDFWLSSFLRICQEQHRTMKKLHKPGFGLFFLKSGIPYRHGDYVNLPCPGASGKPERQSRPTSPQEMCDSDEKPMEFEVNGLCRCSIGMHLAHSAQTRALLEILFFVLSV